MQEDLVSEKFGGVDGGDIRVVGDPGQLVNAAQLDQGAGRLLCSSSTSTAKACAIRMLGAQDGQGIEIRPAPCVGGLCADFAVQA